MAHQPQNLVATPISTTEIDLSWDDVGTLEDETFDIERNSVIVEASYAGTHTLAAPYTDTGLDPNTEYSYRVRAVGGIIPSPVTPPAAAVAARASIFTPVVTVAASVSVTPATVSAVAVVFASDIAATTSTTTPATVVGSASVPTPSIATESYSDSYGLPYGATASFSPSNIAGLVAWYDFSDISALWKDTARTSAVTADADVIKGVTDLSGGGKHLSEATNGPQYKTAIYGSLSVARFDGTNDILKASSFTLNQPETVFIVAKYASVPAGDAWLFDGNTQNSMRLYESSGDAVAMYAGSSGPSKSSAGANSLHIWTALFSGAGSLLYKDGGTASTGNAGANNAGGFTLAADGNSADGFSAIDIAEVVVYNTTLTTTDKNIVGDYLAVKWGLTWTVVT